MIAQGSNAYLNARVSVLADQLLTPQRLEYMAALGLDELGREFELTGLDEETLPPTARLRAVEGALVTTLMRELTVLIRPLYGEARELLIHWARRFELFNLKALIRGKLAGLDEAEIQANLLDLPPFLALPHQALLRTESVQELLRRLEQSQFRAIARQARKLYEEQHEPFALEAAIDQRYLAGLVKRVRQLPGEDLKETQKTLGLHLDRVDLDWLLRYRFYYHLSASETYYQLVPSSLHLHRERLLSLVNLPSLERVLEALPEPLDAVCREAADIPEVDRRMRAFTSRSLRAMVAHNPSSVARALAYLILRDLDMRRLFAMIQGRMLGLSQLTFTEALGLSGAGGEAGPGHGQGTGQRNVA
jgi:V/A-type H+-transporting ATPase subunit C